MRYEKTKCMFCGCLYISPHFGFIDDNGVPLPPMPVCPTCADDGGGVTLGEKDDLDPDSDRGDYGFGGDWWKGENQETED